MRAGLRFEAEQVAAAVSFLSGEAEDVSGVTMATVTGKAAGMDMAGVFDGLCDAVDRAARGAADVLDGTVSSARSAGEQITATDTALGAEARNAKTVG